MDGAQVTNDQQSIGTAHQYSKVTDVQSRSHEDPVTIVSTREDLEKLIGTKHYDRLSTLGWNICNAIEKGFFPTGRPIILKDMSFNLFGEHITIPENVTLQECQFSNGSLMFYHGDVSTEIHDYQKATIYAAGPDAKAYGNSYSISVYAIARGAQAHAESGYSYATAEGAIASGRSALSFEEFLHEIADKDSDLEVPYARIRLLQNDLFFSANDSFTVATNKAKTAATFRLGMLYFERGDVDKAVHYLKNASDRGLVKASFQLGMMYFKGTKVEQSDTNTGTYLKLAYKQGTEKSASDTEKNMAAEAAYQFGESIEERSFFSATRSFLNSDPDTSAEWYKKAADLGHLKARHKVNEQNPASAGGSVAEPKIVTPTDNSVFTELYDSLFRSTAPKVGKEIKDENL